MAGNNPQCHIDAGLIPKSGDSKCIIG